MSLPWESFLPGSNYRHQNGHSDCEGRLAEETGVLLDSLREVSFRTDLPRRSCTLAKTWRINGGFHCSDLDKMELQETVYVNDQSTREYGMF